MDISLGKLVQLTMVARCGSFSRAAEELCLSQPALSRSIAAIERRYGFPIFNRVGHGVEPTAAGAQVLAHAEPLLQSMRVFDRNMDLLATGMAGVLKMGVPPLLASQLLADLAKEFFDSSRKVELRITIRSGPALLESLKNDEIELFLFTDGQVECGPEIDIGVVGTIDPTCVVRFDHPLARRTGLTPKDLSAYPWASSVEPPAMGKGLSSARFVCDNYHVLRDAVQYTDLVCICTKRFVADDLTAGRLVELDVPSFLPRTSDIYIGRLKGRMLSPLAKTAIDRIAALLGGTRT